MKPCRFLEVGYNKAQDDIVPYTHAKAFYDSGLPVSISFYPYLNLIF